jgi:hypothetical protein
MGLPLSTLDMAAAHRRLVSTASHPSGKRSVLTWHLPSHKPCVRAITYPDVPATAHPNSLLAFGSSSDMIRCASVVCRRSASLTSRALHTLPCVSFHFSPSRRPREKTRSIQSDSSVNKPRLKLNFDEAMPGANLRRTQVIVALDRRVFRRKHGKALHFTLGGSAVEHQMLPSMVESCIFPKVRAGSTWAVVYSMAADLGALSSDPSLANGDTSPPGGKTIRDAFWHPRRHYAFANGFFIREWQGIMDGSAGD